MEDIGKIFLLLRKDRKVSQTHLAKQLQITTKTLEAIKTRKTDLEYAMIRKLANGFDITLVEIFNGKQ